MDPYIEAPEIWTDFHNHLGAEIAGRLNPLLRPRYYAALTPYVTYEEVEIGKPRGGRPDVGVLRESSAPYGELAPVTIAPPLAESRVLIEFPLEINSVEIRTTEGHVLVTGIEILSR